MRLDIYFFVSFYSRRAEKYFRRGSRLDWPEGAISRESMRAVWKLPRLQVLLLYSVLKRMWHLVIENINTMEAFCSMLTELIVIFNILRQLLIFYLV